RAIAVGAEMPASDVIEERAERRGRRRRSEFTAHPLRRGGASGDEPDRRRLHIALDAGDLPREAKPRIGFEPERGIEQFRAVEEGIAMQSTEPRELGVLEPRNGAEHARLLAMRQ